MQRATWEPCFSASRSRAFRHDSTPLNGRVGRPCFSALEWVHNFIGGAMWFGWWEAGVRPKNAMLLAIMGSCSLWPPCGCMRFAYTHRHVAVHSSYTGHKLPCLHENCSAFTVVVVLVYVSPWGLRSLPGLSLYWPWGVSLPPWIVCKPLGASSLLCLEKGNGLPRVTWETRISNPFCASSLNCFPIHSPTFCTDRHGDLVYQAD